MGGLGTLGCGCALLLLIALFFLFSFFVRTVSYELIPMVALGVVIIVSAAWLMKKYNEIGERKWRNLENLKKDIIKTTRLLDKKGLLNKSNKQQIDNLSKSLQALRDSMEDTVEYKNRIIEDAKELAIEPLVTRGSHKNPDFKDALKKVDSFYIRKTRVMQECEKIQQDFEKEKNNAALFLSEIRIRATVDKGNELHHEFARHIKTIENARRTIVENIRLENNFE